MSLRDLMLADLESGLAIVRDGHELIPAWRILTPDGDFLILTLTRFDPDRPDQRERMLALVPRFMAWKLATAFVLTAETWLGPRRIRSGGEAVLTIGVSRQQRLGVTRRIRAHRLSPSRRRSGSPPPPSTNTIFGCCRSGKPPSRRRKPPCWRTSATPTTQQGCTSIASKLRIASIHQGVAANAAAMGLEGALMTHLPAPRSRPRSVAARVPVRRSKDVARDAADMIADGTIVGWFQGRMEFGPRALGNRSLLADPRRPDTRAILNRRIEHREDFRPFAPSVLAERADDWFELGPPSASHEYMLFACPTKPGRGERIPAVIHHDGTARVQLVRRQANPRFHDLISRFLARTGVPIVLNTSFNDSEPIVCTPAHAIATFRNTGIDALFISDICLTSQT